MEYANNYCVEFILKKVILIVLKESNLEQQDRLHQITADLACSVFNLLESQKWPALELHCIYNCQTKLLS